MLQRLLRRHIRNFTLLGTRAFSAPGPLVKLSLLVYSRSRLSDLAFERLAPPVG